MKNKVFVRKFASRFSYIVQTQYNICQQSQVRQDVFVRVMAAALMGPGRHEGGCYGSGCGGFSGGCSDVFVVAVAAALMGPG